MMAAPACPLLTASYSWSMSLTKILELSAANTIPALPSAPEALAVRREGQHTARVAEPSVLRLADCELDGEGRRPRRKMGDSSFRAHR